MDLHDLKQHLDNRLDKIETKLEDHLERITRAETSIHWISGHVKTAMSLMLTALIGAISALYNTLK